VEPCAAGRDGYSDTIAEFQADDRSIRFESWMGGPDRPRNGERIGVFYDAADPSDAMIDRAILNWMPWAPCAAIGLRLTLSALRGWLATLRA